MLKPQYVRLLMVAGCLCVFSCESQEVQPNKPQEAITPKRDLQGDTGSDLFKSVMFGTGDFAKQIPSLKASNERYEQLSYQDKRETDARINQLIQVIEKNDPEFFNLFKKRLISKDHAEVKEAIRMASLGIADNIEIILPGFTEKLKPRIEADVQNGSMLTDNAVDQNKLKSKIDEYKNIIQTNSGQDGAEAPCTLGIACVVYFAVAAHNTLAVTANVAVALSVWKYAGFWSAAPTTDEQSQLQLEIMVNDIITAS